MLIYFGDDDTSRAAIYLAGVLSYYKIPFDRVNSGDAPPADFRSKPYSLYILSDYPRERFREGDLEHIAKAVSEGAGLLMIGGWESFHGKNGEYHQSPLVEVLPVQMSDQDDRRNYAQPLFIRKLRPHPITEGLLWSSPPTIGGFNTVKPKENAQTILDAIRIDVKITDDEGEIADCRIAGVCEIDGHQLVYRSTLDLKTGETMIFSEVETVPLLVVGSYGRGRTAAFTSDVAPHWVGGLVDWGKQRITQSVGEGFIEVGDFYAKFLCNLVQWTGSLK